VAPIISDIAPRVSFAVALLLMAAVSTTVAVAAGAYVRGVLGR